MYVKYIQHGIFGIRIFVVENKVLGDSGMDPIKK